MSLGAALVDALRIRAQSIGEGSEQSHVTDHTLMPVHPRVNQWINQKYSRPRVDPVSTPIHLQKDPSFEAT